MKNMFKIILLSIFIILNAYIYFRVRNVLPDLCWVKIVYNLFFAAIVGIFMYCVIFIEQISALTFTHIMNYAVTWILIIFYLMLILSLVDIVNILNKYFNFLPFKPNQIEIKRIIILSAFAIIALILVWGRYNFSNKKVETLSININKKAKVENLKIVAASDLHLGYSIDKKQLKEIVDLINVQNPDIILLAGDIIDRNLEPLINQNMKEELLQLKAPLGVYGIIGNHECYGGETKQIVDYFELSGITMLQDSAVLLENDIYIVGRNDKMIKARKTIDELVENIDKQKPVILLDHQPFNLEYAQKNEIDLQLSGHTHGGQIFPFTLITKLTYEKHHGYLKKGNTHYYISSGVSGWGPKLRIGSQCEIAVITLNFLSE